MILFISCTFSHMQMSCTLSVCTVSYSVISVRHWRRKSFLNVDFIQMVTVLKKVIKSSLYVITVTCSVNLIVFYLAY